MDTLQKSYLVETARWQKVLGVLMAIGTGIIAVVGIIFLIFGNAIPATQTAEFGSIGSRIVGVVYLLMAVLYYFFAHYLLRSAKYLKAWGMSEAENESDLTEGLKSTKSYFKYSGILSLVSIGLVLVIVIVAAIAAIVAA